MDTYPIRENRKPRTKKERAKNQIVFADKGRTKQDQTDSCDINKIMDRYTKTGLIPHGNPFTPEQGYAPDIDFHEAQNIIAHGKEIFAELDSKTRKRFDNDPGKYLDYIQDPDNQDELVKMGLATEKTPAEKIEPAKKEEKSPSPGKPEQKTEDPPK